MKQWTEAQKNAIEKMGTSLVIRATAGSGKTRVLIEKVLKIHREHKISLDQIIVVTFTEKAAWELKERLARALSCPLSELHSVPIGTFHSLAARLLREKGALLNLPAGWTILDEAASHIERLQTIQEGLISLLKAKEEKALYLTEFYGFQPLIRMFTKALDQPFRLIHDAKKEPLAHNFSEVLKNIITLYGERKRQLNLLDFNDLEQYAIQLLKIPSVHDHYLDDFKYIFVDEFQDVNPTQITLLHGLHHPEKNHLVIVGDPLQSIYRFRGSDASLFQTMEKTITNNGGSVLYLTTNFRTQADLIQSINHLFSSIFQKDYQPMTAHKGQPSLFPSGLDWILLKEKLSADKRRLYESKTIMDRLTHWHEKGYAWRDMALLFRTRTAIPHYKLALRKAGIPFRSQSETPLLECQEVLDCLQFLKIIAHPQDWIAWLGLYRSPLFNIPIETLWSHKEQYFSEKRVHIHNEPHKKTMDWMNEIEKNRDLCLPSELILSFIDWIENHSYYTSSQQRANLHKWYGMALSLERLRPLTLKNFLLNIEGLKDESHLLGEASLTASEDEAVSLMTIHASKGLEFPIVALPDLKFQRHSGPSPFIWDEEKGWALKTPDPSSSGLKTQWLKSPCYEEILKESERKDLEESKRLLYVGCTRAIDKLILSLDVSTKTKKDSISWNDWFVQAFVEKA
ncbi:MAG: hypothetical protein A2053_01290 [Deltaproteobacteria bacterium GWA2_50_8]|nr:MAG: hypothetical protein A2053_01290 [Deltaproteobacteria bacterium GWA2_50_8]